MADAKRRWSYSAGERGRNRVRVFEDNRTRSILVEFNEPSPLTGKLKRKRVSLGHSDRNQAKQQADEMAARFATTGRKPEVRASLQQLFDIYGREVTPEKAEGTQKHDRMCARMFLDFFGRARRAETLSRRDWDRFIRERRTGKVVPAVRPGSGGVGDRQIAYDLSWLRAVLNWATLAGDGNGGVLLERNPLKGLPLPREESPKRPVVTQERYEAMLAFAADVDRRFELALILAHETGHRIGAVRMLRWSDVDLGRRVVRWRAEDDKIGFEHETPISEVAVAALERVRHEAPAIGEAWVLPSPKDLGRPCSRHLVRDWWRRAEELTGLEHVPGLGWHGLRRKFATELKQVSLKDLAQLGGWKDPQTILKCYQSADEESMRAALAERRVLRGAAGG
jgi:integrase